MQDGFLTDRRKELEESFFHRLEVKQLEKMQQEQQKADRRQALKNASGIADPALLDKLLELEISPQTLAALTLTPLIEVAWADGKMEDKERTAILAAAEDQGVQKQSAASELLQAWLNHRPGPELMQTWQDYIQQLGKQMSAEEFTGLKLAVLHRARAVAEAAGGFLGLGNKVSKEEEQVLQKLEKAFTN